jgi:transcription antitermination factor NusG
MREWHAVHTKPHKEFMVRAALSAVEDVQVFLPTLHVKPVNPRSRKIRPFFPGYLFVQVDLVQVGLSAIQWNPGVVRVVTQGDQPIAIPEPVIEQVRRRVEEVQARGDNPFDRFQHGDCVRITRGPFEGYEGMFDTRLQGRERVRILVEFLGRLTTAEVNVRDLDKISRPHDH